MIAQLTGTVTEVADDHVIFTVNGVGYEVMIPLGSRPALSQRLRLPDTLLYTIEYLEGVAGRGNLVPRLVGFLTTLEKEFFEMFTTVDGIGPRKALRALAAPVADIAVAVEKRDTKRLSELPEVGKRTAEKIIAQLHGKLEKFAWPSGITEPSAPREPLAAWKREALDVLLQLGEKPAEAEELIARACRLRPEMKTANELVNEIYRNKGGKRG